MGIKDSSLSVCGCALAAPTYTHTLSAGAMQSNPYLIRSWVGELMSAAVWLQVALLSGDKVNQGV